MVRKLRFHEQKLLKKVDFINWEVDNNLHEVKMLRKFHIEKREDYTKWVRYMANRGYLTAHWMVIVFNIIKV